MDMFKDIDWKKALLYAVVIIALILIAMVIWTKVVEPQISKNKVILNTATPPAAKMEAAAPATQNYGGAMYLRKDSIGN